MRRFWLGAIATAVVFASAGDAVAEPPGERPVRVRWVAPATQPAALEVSGLDAASVERLGGAHWTAAQWQSLLPVYAGGAEGGDVPPMLGTYRVTSGVLRFEPQFPLEPGVRYRAVFHPDRLPGAGAQGAAVSAVYVLVPQHIEPSTVVSHVYPSAEVLPENLLKFYVHFSAAMSGGDIYEHIHLRDEAGKEVELPFLEIHEELWDPGMTRLTLLMDPGRIKRGVRPLEEIGPALREGKRYTLVIDREWRDAAGAPLKEGFGKEFKVGPPDREAVDPAKWKVRPGAAGTRGPMAVEFEKPMDHALAERVISVRNAAGMAVAGVARLGDQERLWKFTPAGPWEAGRYEVVVEATIEDLAGNNIGKPFEVDLFEGVERHVTAPTVKLPFEVK